MRLSLSRYSQARRTVVFVEVPGEQGLYTQVRRLDQAEAMIREVISLVARVPQTPSISSSTRPRIAWGSREAVEAALRERERASAAQEAASTAMRHAVSEVRASGVHIARRRHAALGSATTNHPGSSVGQRIVRARRGSTGLAALRGWSDGHSQSTTARVLLLGR